MVADAKTLEPVARDGQTLGEVFMRRGLHGEALERFREAREGLPEDPAVLNGTAPPATVKVSCELIGRPATSAQRWSPLPGREASVTVFREAAVTLKYQGIPSHSSLRFSVGVPSIRRRNSSPV